MRCVLVLAKIKNLGGNINEIKEEDISARTIVLKKTLEDLEVKNILLDKNKNIIKDINHNKISIRFQRLLDYPVKRIQNFIEEQRKQSIKQIIIYFYFSWLRITIFLRKTKINKVLTQINYSIWTFLFLK